MYNSLIIRIQTYPFLELITSIIIIIIRVSNERHHVNSRNEQIETFPSLSTLTHSLTNIYYSLNSITVSRYSSQFYFNHILRPWNLRHARILSKFHSRSGDVRNPDRSIDDILQARRPLKTGQRAGLCVRACEMPLIDVSICF